MVTVGCYVDIADVTKKVMKGKKNSPGEWWIEKTSSVCMYEYFLSLSQTSQNRGSN